MLAFLNQAQPFCYGRIDVPHNSATLLRDYLDVATTLAREAGSLALSHYQRGVKVERKPDQSPVTEADRGAEQLIRERLGARFPEHAILGEEFGADKAGATHRWIIDPIDGTIVVGVCHLPAVSETLAAARSQGCTWNGRPTQASRTSTLEEATVVYSDGRLLRRRLGTRWAALQDASGELRGWGDCYGHCLVATGRADVMLDSVMNPWDCAALLPIVEESGGQFTDWRGDARIDGGDAVSTNGRLHGAVLEFLWEREHA